MPKIQAENLGRKFLRKILAENLGASQNLGRYTEFYAPGKNSGVQ
jgi:hypothetical protein